MSTGTWKAASPGALEFCLDFEDLTDAVELRRDFEKALNMPAMVIRCSLRVRARKVRFEQVNGTGYVVSYDCGIG